MHNFITRLNAMNDHISSSFSFDACSKVICVLCRCLHLNYTSSYFSRKLSSSYGLEFHLVGLKGLVERLFVICAYSIEPHAASVSQIRFLEIKLSHLSFTRLTHRICLHSTPHAISILNLFRFSRS